MSLDKKQLKIERIRGSGPGGQNRNKVASCVRITHIPTGISVRIDGRDQAKNLKMAEKELERRLSQAKDDAAAAQRKSRRDVAIKDSKTIRDYDFTTGLVSDRRTGKSAPIKQVLVKGKINLISPSHVHNHDPRD